jgi:hypothetical protein
MQLANSEEVLSMCYERLWRRREETEEGRELWHDFERTRPVSDPQPPVEVTDPEPAEAREEIAAS